MPKMYEAIRDKFIAQGMPTKEAKTRAAKIYNASKQGKKNPLHGKSESEDYSSDKKKKMKYKNGDYRKARKMMYGKK